MLCAGSIEGVFVDYLSILTLMHNRGAHEYRRKVVSRSGSYHVVKLMVARSQRLQRRREKKKDKEKEKKKEKTRLVVRQRGVSWGVVG
jgi:hypothetical protein